MTDASRRDVLRAAAGGAVGLSLPLAACGGSGSSDLAVERLSDELVVVAGAGANVVAARGADGLVMVDGGLPEWSEELLRVVRAELRDRDVATLFNTHWHPEQTGSNAALGRAGTAILAHANTKQWMGSEIHVRWTDEVYPPFPDEALPTQTFYETGEMAHGEGGVAYGHMLHAHTDGDIYVKFVDDNVLVAGGALTSDRWPVIDWWTGGYIGGLLDAHQILLAQSDAETRIVPSNGPVMTRADLEMQAEMYQTIFERLGDLLKSSQSPAEAVDAHPTEGFMEDWPGRDQFVELAFRSFYGHLRGNRRLGPMP